MPANENLSPEEIEQLEVFEEAIEGLLGAITQNILSHEQMTPFDLNKNPN
ncbi:MAG: hypothetical protein LBF15_01875 [Candidatus Peribacteria bacterium]|nr:hypothetical protein [Candidatus Peribacteria bacterium]